MAYEYMLESLGTMTAVGNYSSASSQFTLCKTTGAGTFSKQTTAGGVVLGVLQDLPSSGYVGSLGVKGVTKVRVNTTSHAAIAVGDKLCASSGAGVRGSTAVGRFVVGRALQAQTVNTTGIISMLITMEGAGSTSAAAGA